MNELLTIALPVYKRTDFVRSALDSAIKQTLPCRVLLIDNCSPHDDFKTIVESYNNPLMRYVRTNETVPQDENFNNCFRYAETPWVTILHDDDMLHCQFSELAQKLIHTYSGRIGGFVVKSKVGEEEWHGVFAPYSQLPDTYRWIKEPFFYFAHLTPFPGVVLKKDVALKIGGFTNTLFPIADFDFWYRYSQLEQFLKVDQHFSYYRISPSQSTNNMFYDMINKSYTYRKRIIREGKHNNLLTWLGLEYSKINNINYFRKTYTYFQAKGNITHTSSTNLAKVFLAIPGMKRMVKKYIIRLSYEKA